MNELGLWAIGINDVGGVYGIPKAYWARRNNPNLKLIVGADLILENNPNVTLLCQDRKAYGLMCRMITQSHAGREGDCNRK